MLSRTNLLTAQLLQSLYAQKLAKNRMVLLSGNRLLAQITLSFHYCGLCLTNTDDCAPTGESQIFLLEHFKGHQANDQGHHGGNCICEVSGLKLQSTATYLLVRLRWCSQILSFSAASCISVSAGHQKRKSNTHDLIIIYIVIKCLLLNVRHLLDKDQGAWTDTNILIQVFNEFIMKPLHWYSPNSPDVITRIIVHVPFWWAISLCIIQWSAHF